MDGRNIPIKGNSDIAHALAGLRDKVFTFPENLTALKEGTTDDFFRAVVGDLGVKAADATRTKQNQQDIVDSIDMRRQSVSGVSLDEEMADLIRFQHAYNAAARNVTVVDEILDRVINHMGIVRALMDHGSYAECAVLGGGPRESNESDDEHPAAAKFAPEQ